MLKLSNTLISFRPSYTNSIKGEIKSINKSSNARCDEPILPDKALLLIGMYLQGMILNLLHLLPLRLQLFGDILIGGLRRVPIILYVEQVILVHCAQRVPPRRRLFIVLRQVGLMLDLLYELGLAQQTVDEDPRFILR